MALKSHGFWSAVLGIGLMVALSAQTPASAPAQDNQTPTFRVQINLATTDVTVKDAKGNFVDDLTRDEFEVYEDGVKQTLVSMTMSHGGRVVNLLAPPPPPPREGIVLPAVKRVNDTTGRIFLFFIDDRNIQFKNTTQIRMIFNKIARTLLHDGDLLGITSSGPSSIYVPLTYDIKQLERVIDKMTGDGLKPSEIIQQSLSGSEGPTELKFRASVSFKVMHEAIENLEQVRDRRKAIVWVSEGYDYNPFQAARYGLYGPNSNYTQALSHMLDQPPPNTDPSAPSTSLSPRDPNSLEKYLMRNETFSDADLWRDIAEITRAAARANVVIYPVDPRGLMAGPDIDENLDTTAWNEYVRKSQDVERVLAEETGGIAIVNTNDFDKGLKLIDNASSDYYVLGYYPTNPDPTKRKRKIEIKILRNGITATYRPEYLFKNIPTGAPNP